MRTPSRFWSGLEAVRGLAAITAEWSEVWGPDWDVGQTFLRPSGQLADRYPCLYPGSDGCPRRVIVRSQSDIVAVCGAVPRECDDLQLTKADIVVWELDWRRLGAAIASALGFSAPERPTEVLHHTQRIAWHHLVGGKRAAVYLAIQDDATTFAATLSHLLRGVNLPLILVAPTASLCDSDSMELLRRTGVLFLPLDECLAWDEGGGIAATDRARERLSGVATVPQVTARASRGSARPVATPVDVPPGAAWDELYLVVDGRTLEYRLRDRHGAFTHVEAGCANWRCRYQPPNRLWGVLSGFAAGNGQLRRDPPTPEQRRNLTQQVHDLGAALRGLFPIVGKPFSKPRDDCYRAAFHIRLEGGVMVPVPNGCTWSRVAIVETRDGNIRFGLQRTRPFMVYDNGHAAHRGRVAAEELAVTSIERTLEQLGLVRDDGEVSPEGKALVEALRSGQGIERDWDDESMLGLCNRLCQLTNIEESPFDFRPQQARWVPLFEAVSERRQM